MNSVNTTRQTHTSSQAKRKRKKKNELEKTHPSHGLDIFSG
jgi:hypothetical protein